MARLTGATIAIAAREREVLTTVRFEVAWLLPTADERTTAVGTAWAVGSGAGLPVGSLALKCELLEHTCAQAIPALVQCLFDLGDRGIGMLQVPLAHTSQDVRVERILSRVRCLIVHGFPPSSTTPTQ